MPKQRTTVEARLYMRSYTSAWRSRVLMFFGGKCEHCGINDSRVLQLDHINGGGSKERTSRRWNSHLVAKDAITRPFEFQVLCANCNWIKRFEQGETGNRLPDTPLPDSLMENK